MVDYQDDNFINKDDADSTVFFGGAEPGQNTALRPGEIIDDTYRLIKEIGRGGMGVVFSCTHIALAKQYAIKLLIADQLNDEAWKRFQIEAKALARLNHHGIVGIHNMGLHHGSEFDTPYYVMDLLSGENLEDLIRNTGPLQDNQALYFFTQVADALHSAHLQGIIHRDIKPSNLMLMRDGNDNINQVKVVDFGIARMNNSGLGTQSQTATGLVFGTPYYMSPEQCRGERVDERSDIYSFGCTLFEALTGAPPFVGSNAFQTFMMHQTEPPPSLASKSAAPRGTREFSESLEALVEKTLCKDTSNRYQTMEQLKHDLARVKQGKSIAKKGLSSTAELSRPSRDRERKDTKEQRASGKEFETESSTPALDKRLIFAGAVIILGLAAGLYNLVTQLSKAIFDTVNNKAVATHPDPASTDFELQGASSPAELNKAGASQSDREMFRNYSAEKEIDNELEYREKFINVLKNTPFRDGLAVPFKRNGVFHFPSDFYFGAIQVGDGPIQNATKNIAVDLPGKKQSEIDVHYYYSPLLKQHPEALELFGPNDLTGIDIVLDKPLDAASRLCKWHRLKDLSFFNSITKALPKFEDLVEESPVTDEMLPAINSSFQNLRSLGLAGHRVSGGAIAKMPLLKKLKSLKIKRISDFADLLEALPNHDNIEELWLMSLYLEDKDLEPLTRMKNLKTLRITRSKLTPDSLQYFKRMPALKKLKLDRTWPEETKEKFKQLPGYEFERVFDQHFWNYGPGGMYP